MKKILFVISFALAVSSVYAQARVTGIWQAEVASAGPGLWTVDLKFDRDKLTGSISQDADDPTDIEAGRVEGNTVIFKVTVGTDRTITFTGKINGDQIVFTRDVVMRPGGAPGGR